MYKIFRKDCSVKILIAEDNPKHITDAKQVADSLGVEVIVIQTATEAHNHIDSVDGVITDVYMPYAPGRRHANNNQPCGLIVGALAQRAGIPFVFCTDGYHHGLKFDWINHLFGITKMGYMIDGSDDELITAEKKSWEIAFKVIINKVQNPKPD